MWLVLLSTIIVYSFGRTLLFIHLNLAIIVYPFIFGHYCLSFYCRLLLFILLLSSIIVYPIIVDHYFLILLWSTIIVYPFIFGHYWASIKNISVCPNLTHRCEVWVGRLVNKNLFFSFFWIKFVKHLLLSSRKDTLSGSKFIQHIRLETIMQHQVHVLPVFDRISFKY